MPEPALLVALALAVGLAAFINGTIGFGFALLAVNALAVVMGAKSGVVVMSLLAPVVSGLQLIHHRDFIPPWRRLAWLLGGAILGSIVGTQLLVALPSPLISIALGVFTIGYVAVTLPGERPPLALHIERRLAPLAGFVGGLSNGALGASGPVFGTYLTAIGLRGRDFTAAISGMFFTLGILRIGQLALLDQYSTPLLAIAGLLIVPSVVVQRVGQWFRGRLPAALVYRGVLIVLALAGVSLIIRGVDGLIAG
jgi:uncharacterized membrane protein YfcA